MIYALFVLIAYILYTFTMMLIDSRKSNEEDELESGMFKMETSETLKPIEQENNNERLNTLNESEFKNKEQDKNKEDNSTIKNAILDEDDEILSNDDLKDNESEIHFQQKEVNQVNLNEDFEDNSDSDNPYDNLMDESLNKEKAEEKLHKNEKNSDLVKSNDVSVDTNQVAYEENNSLLEYDAELKLKEAKSIFVSSI